MFLERLLRVLAQPLFREDMQALANRQLAFYERFTPD
jgi:hypothetical protein